MYNGIYQPAKNMSPFFDVIRKPLSTEFQGGVLDVEKDVLLAPNGNVLGFVSRDYNIVKNEDVAALFDEYFSGIKIHSVKDMVSVSGEKWMREYVLDEDGYTVSIGNDDTIKTKVVICNGYDAKTSVGLAISAWRQVCSNGMMGWKRMIGTTFGHFLSDIINKLQSKIDTGFIEMKKNFGVWEMWTEESFNQKDFNEFVESRKFLSDKKKEKISGLYEPVMNKYKEQETRWGAYNVLTAIATHHIESRNKDVAKEFSNGYREMVRVTKDFWNYEK